MVISDATIQRIFVAMLDEQREWKGKSIGAMESGKELIDLIVDQVKSAEGLLQYIKNFDEHERFERILYSSFGTVMGKLHALLGSEAPLARIAGEIAEAVKKQGDPSLDGRLDDFRSLDVAGREAALQEKIHWKKE